MSKEMYGEIKNAYYDQVGDNFLIYAFSKKYKRVVNTHMFPDVKEAQATIRDINETRN